MEKAHRAKFAPKFKNSLNAQRVVCLNVSDRYEFMEPALIRLFTECVPKFLGSAGPSNMAVDTGVLSVGFRQLTVRRSLLR